MVKFTKTSQVAEACLDSMKRNHLCTKIGSKKYEKVVRKVKAGLKRGSMKCIWKHFIKYKQYVSREDYLNLKKDFIDYYYANSKDSIPNFKGQITLKEMATERSKRYGINKKQSKLVRKRNNIVIWGEEKSKKSPSKTALWRNIASKGKYYKLGKK